MNYYHSSLEAGKGLPVILITSILVLVIGGFITLFLTGFIKVGSYSVAAQSGLCHSLIEDYNSAFTQPNADAYALKLSSNARKAADTEGNQGDPNCVYIQFTNAVYLKNTADATKFSDLLVSLSKDDKYITGELANPLGLDAIQTTTKALSSPIDTEPKTSAQGNG
ncbi:MAG: hypothetical protein WAQ27_00305 [Candidatus Microsaccharimonas sp.]